MQRCAFTPYEGHKPYIFISYAHKDARLVFPILEELDRRGYRVWYDDGIAPGSEWPENIAQHLDGCSLTLAFISPNSIASANCRREVTFALSKRKNFLGIVLEPTEMSLGMEMQLSAQQCIMKYTYSTEADFFRKVCSCPDMEPCLGTPKTAAVEAPPAPAEPVRRAVPEPQPHKERKPVNKKLILAAVAAVAVILAIVLGIALGSKDGDDPSGSPGSTGESQNGSTPGSEPEKTEPEDTEPEDTEPEEPDEGETFLSYSNVIITDKEVAYMNQQKNLEIIEFHDCVIKNGAFDTLDLATTVTEIVMENCQGVTNLHCLGAMEDLEILHIINCGISDRDLPKFNSQALWDVNISGNPNLTNLSFFEYCTGINELNFSGTGVASVEILAGMEDLNIVNGSNTDVKDLTAVANLVNLHEMYFSGCGIESMDAPVYSLHLEKLDLSCNKLTRIDALQYCTALGWVNLSFNKLEDVDVLEKSAQSLVELNLCGNTELSYLNVRFLSGCVCLERLNLDGLYMSDLDALEGMTSLTYLSAVDCHLWEIDAIASLTELEYVNLAFNQISDVSPLEQLPKDWLTLDLSFNDSLEDVSYIGAKNYALLNLTNAYLDPYTVPSAGGNTLVFAYNDAWQNENCMDESGSDIFERIAIVACPLDKVVAMEKRFDKDRTSFLQDDESYLAFLEEKGIDCAYLRNNKLNQ